MNVVMATFMLVYNTWIYITPILHLKMNVGLFWVLLKKKSFVIFKRVEKLVIISIAISLLIGLIGIYIASRLFTKPIVLLANKVRNSNPSKPVNLDKINISEIDELSSAIELLSANVADSSSKLSQIIEMVDMPIELLSYTKRRECFCTKNF